MLVSQYMCSKIRKVGSQSILGKFKGAESMITSRIALDDVVEQGFDQLVQFKDKHSKIIATPKPELLPRKRRNTGATNGT